MIIKRVNEKFKRGHRVTMYGDVQFPEKRKHMVVKHQEKKVKTFYTCDCQDYTFRHRTCKHIKEFKRAEKGRNKI